MSISPLRTKKLKVVWSRRATDYVTSLAWCPEGRRLAAGTGAGTVEIYGEGGEVVARVEAHRLGVEDVVWTGQGIFSGGQDGRWCRLIEEGLRLQVLQEGGAWVQRVAWSRKQGSRLAVVAGRKIWLCGADGTVRHTVEEKGYAFQDAAWDPEGKWLLTAGYGGVKVWDGEDGALLSTYAWPSAIWSCRWSPDGRWLAGGSQENAVHIWDARNGTHLHMPGYGGKVRCLDWSADSRWLATAGGPDVVLWDCSGAGPEGRSGKTLVAHSEMVGALAFAPSGTLLASGGAEGRLIIWRAEGEDEAVGAAVLEEPLTRLVWSPDGGHLAAGTARGAVAVFSIG